MLSLIHSTGWGSSPINKDAPTQQELIVQGWSKMRRVGNLISLFAKKRWLLVNILTGFYNQFYHVKICWMNVKIAKCFVMSTFVMLQRWASIAASYTVRTTFHDLSNNIFIMFAVFINRSQELLKCQHFYLCTCYRDSSSGRLSSTAILYDHTHLSTVRR